jgi:hypothetical protein
VDRQKVGDRRENIDIFDISVADHSGILPGQLDEQRDREDVGEVSGIRAAAGFSRPEADSVIGRHYQKTLVVESRLSKPVVQPPHEPIDVFQLEQVSLLTLDDKKFVSPPEVAKFIVGVKVQQFELLAFRQVIASRGKITPGDMGQQNVLKVDGRLKRIVEAFEEMLELCAAVLAPVEAKNSPSLIAIDVSGITQTKPQPRNFGEVLVKVIRNQVK